MTNDARQAIERVGGAARVAAEAGLSAMTVRRAMAGMRVHPGTARAIAEATERLGDGIHVAEVVNSHGGEIHYIAVGLTSYRIRIRMFGATKYRADVHYQLRHGETAWHAVGRVEAGTKAALVVAGKAKAAESIDAHRRDIVDALVERMGSRECTAEKGG